MMLADLKPGQSGKILKISVTGALKRRLMDMGVVGG
ncbi:MAG TPA: ferrous iron transport protein A, partial [Deltaproteobacteria bacterium]|nr:ferrous iron transport protein A [Deltaproteobacteria bacterium]